MSQGNATGGKRAVGLVMYILLRPYGLVREVELQEVEPYPEEDVREPAKRVYWCSDKREYSLQERRVRVSSTCRDSKWHTRTLGMSVVLKSDFVNRKAVMAW